MLNTVDPIGRGELPVSYLEFYNCCYSSRAICLGALIIITMDPIGQNLQVTKLLIYLLMTNHADYRKVAVKF